jgi:hypothetical protein
MPSVAEEPVFDPAPMQDIGAWLSSSGSRILFIYGETDPWTAGAFELGGAKESYSFVMPAGNHGANILGLLPGDKQTALDALEAWTGVVPDTQQKVMQPRPAPPPFRLVRRLKTH